MNKKGNKLKNGNYIIENKEKLLYKRKSKEKDKKTSLVIYNNDIYLGYIMS